MLRLTEAEGRREREGGRMGKEKEGGGGRQEERRREGGKVEGKKREEERREREVWEVSRDLKEVGRVYSLFQK